MGENRTFKNAAIIFDCLLCIVENNSEKIPVSKKKKCNDEKTLVLMKIFCYMYRFGQIKTDLKIY